MDWGEGPRVLIQGESQGTLRCLDGDGVEMWHQNTGGAIGIHVGIAPVSIEGEWRIFVSHNRTGQYLLDTEGKIIWSKAYAGGSGAFGPSVADIDGDGEPEILLARREFPILRVLDIRGEVKSTLDMGGSFDGAPLVADLDGDGVLEFIILDIETGRISGMRYGDATSGGKIQWPSARGPFDGRGSVIGSGPASRGTKRGEVAAEEMILDIGPSIVTGSQPLAWQTRAGVDLETIVTGPDGVRHGYPRRLADRIHGHIDAVLDGTYSVTGAAFEDDGSCVASGIYSFDFKAFSFERNRAEGVLAKLTKIEERVGKDHPSAAQDVSRQVRIAREEWNALNFRIDDYAKVAIDDVRNLLARLDRLAGTLDLAEDLRSSIEGPVEFVAWKPANPWVNFSPSTDLPPDDMLTHIEVTTDRHGHEATVIEFANATGGTISLRLWMDDWAREGGESSSKNGVPTREAVTLRKQVFVPTARRNMTPDALPTLNEAGLLTIPAGESARLWIDWDSADADPGVYTSKLHARTLTVPGQVKDIPMRWEISPLELPEQSPLMFHVWAYENRGVPFTEAVYRDLIDHYVNVFDLPVPIATYSTGGTLCELDWGATDRVIGRVPTESFFLWHGGEGIVQPSEGAPGVGSEAWRAGFERYVQSFIEGLKERGIGYDRHANYIIDEPGGAGGERVELHERVAKLYLAVDPEIRIFANPAGGATTEHIERILAVSHILDPIWVYSDQWGLYDHLPLILERAPIVWTYACGDGAKDQTRMEYYWAPIWRGTQLGLTGIGFWSYAGRTVDMWQGPLGVGCDWELVYPGDGTIVPSHRWQGLRLGVEDYMRLVMIKGAANAARERGDGPHADELESRRDQLIARVVDSGHDEGIVADVRSELRALLLSEMDLLPSVGNKTLQPGNLPNNKGG
jgi:hypothetical protein